MEVAVIQECVERSLAGTIAFPEVVRRLAGAGVERYRADLVRQETCFYAPDGAWSAARIALERPLGVAERFSAEGVGSAVRESQQGRIGYREFLGRIAAAGCCCYQVYIREGRMVVYEGRAGETHIERFPGADR